MMLDGDQAPAALVPADVPLAGLQLIEASAGTGKTWNICVLYVRLMLEHQLTVQQILVVTFTKSATAELRERIRSRLTEVLAVLEALQRTEAGISEPPARALAAESLLWSLVTAARQLTGQPLAALHARVVLALHSFDQAAIFTIHGFCQRALGDAPFVAGVPLSVELLQDDEALRLEVVQDAWRRQLDRAPPSAALAQALVREGLDPLRVAHLLQSHLGKPLARVRWPHGTEQTESVEDADAVAQVVHTWTELDALWRADADTIRAQLAACCDGLDQRTHSRGALARAEADWVRLLESGDAFAALKGGKHHLYRRDQLKFTARGARLALTAPTHPFFACVDVYLDARAVADTGLRIALLRWLRALLTQAQELLARRKAELRVQSFDDLLTGLYRALEGPSGSALAAQLQTRFPVALVDEFQDTDPQQLAILERLYGGVRGVLFLVGDPKQAIYSFRNADLQTYLQARAKASAVWTLARNQRSGGRLIKALNGLFTRNPQAFLLDGLHYRALHTGDKAVAALAEQTQHGHVAPAALQVWLLPQDERGLPLASRQCIALVEDSVSDEIIRLIDGGRRGTIQLGGRPLGAGDIAVLVRSHAQGKRVRQTLQARGVASVELSQADIFASLDAEEVLRVLHAVADPLHAGRLFAALGTDLLGWSASALDALQRDESRLVRAMQDFDTALQRWRGRGFGLMFRRLLEDLGVDIRLLARADGARRLTNIRHLAELLHEAAARHDSPAALLHWLESRMQRGAGDEVRQVRLESDAHLVQIVTVHAAKGLEYPVVFCVDLWKTSPPPATQAGLLREYHAMDGLTVLDYRNDDELKTEEDARAIADRQKREHFGEQLRLIYVALTRASARCYVVAGAFGAARRTSAGAAAATAPSTRAAGTTALNWLPVPDGGDWTMWSSTVRDVPAIEQAWRAAQDAVADAEALSVVRLPAGLGRRLQEPELAVSRLRAQAPPLFVPPRKRITSYSAIVQGVSARGNVSTMEASAFADRLGRDHDGEVTLALPPDVSPAADDILHFPRGSAAGTCLHAVLEQTDFADPSGWPNAVASALENHAPLMAGAVGRTRQVAWRSMLLGWLQQMSVVRLPFGATLADLDTRRRLHEVEFHLPAPGLRPATLAAVLRRQGFQRTAFQFEPVYGYLKGFIDLVFEHDQRWYIVDWKSNHLGERREDYGTDSLARAMEQHDYPLQALIYLLVLHRFLQRRLVDYCAERHLGGALYLFVRGVRPDWVTDAGSPPGVWFLRPDVEVLEDLANALEGDAP